MVPQPQPRVRSRRRGRHRCPHHHPTRSTRSTTMPSPLSLMPILVTITPQVPQSSSNPQAWMSHHPILSLGGTDRAQHDKEKPASSIMECSGVRTSRDTETIVEEHLLAAVTVASTARCPLTETESAKSAAPRQHPQQHPELGETRTSAVPRAPRLTDREHPFLFDISWRPTAAREDPCFVVCSLFFFFCLSLSLFLRLCISVRELCAHTQLCVATTARSNCLSPRRAPTLASCVRQ